MRTLNKKIYLLPVVLVVFLAIVQIILCNQLAAKGEMLEKIEAEKEELEREDMKLKERIALKVSLFSLAKEAEEKGFLKNPKILNLKTSEKIAHLWQ